MAAPDGVTGAGAGTRSATGAIWHPSPNVNRRRGGARPDLVVLHYTAMDTAEAALARLCDPAAEVSAHYLIAADGRLWQMADEAMRAWHAGAGLWGGCADVNSASIGIELDNDGDSPFAAPMMDRLEAVLGEIMARWAIPPARVIGHSDMAPGRKHDPGPRFDWQRLARRGLSVWPGGEGEGDADFDRCARRFGYADGAAALHAFRARFRPWARGPVEAADRAAISSLASLFPVNKH